MDEGCTSYSIVMIIKVLYDVWEEISVKQGRILLIRYFSQGIWC